MIRRASCRGLGLLSPLEVGVMTCAMELARCTSVVGLPLFRFHFARVCTSTTHALSFHASSSLTLSCCCHLQLRSFLLFSPVTCSFIFLQGLALGGVWGVSEGARRPLAVSNTRLRINSVLNSVTRRGTFIGNSAGVLGESFPVGDHLISLIFHDSQPSFITESTHLLTLFAENTIQLAAWLRVH